jgi:DNA-binding response OmpR family regulator
MPGSVSMAANHPPGAIILDLGLHDIDGTEVIVELRRWYKAPIITRATARPEPCGRPTRGEPP